MVQSKKHHSKTSLLTGVISETLTEATVFIAGIRAWQMKADVTIAQLRKYLKTLSCIWTPKSIDIYEHVLTKCFLEFKRAV